jgi:2-dehydro-3-deoxyphosphogluconate aldolase / (4S)-4-hydroxy-2-oxoglutarate aldolase
MKIKEVVTTLVRDGFILVFNQDKLDVVKTAGALVKAGVNNMEVTCRISNPLNKIARLREELPGFVTGAASLIDFPAMLTSYNNMNHPDPLPDIDQAVEAGADYLVSAANFSDATYKKLAGKTTLIPGCGTTTEIAQQFSQGANFCKLFPAQQIGGASFIKAIDPALHKFISIIPTGGTNLDNIADYIDAGVLVLGGSFSMIEKTTLKKIIDQQDYDLLARELVAIKKLIDTCRRKKWPQIDFATASLENVSNITGRNFNI